MGDEEEIRSRMKWVVEKGLEKSDPVEYSRFIALSEHEKEKYIKENWKKFRIEPDEACLKEMNELFHPLLKNATDLGFTEIIGQELAATMYRKLPNVMEFHMTMFGIVKNVPNRPPRETIQLYLPSYLMVFEGAFTSMVDLLTFLVVLSGREHYHTKRGSIKSVTIQDLRQIRNDRMRAKLKYLRKEGFGFVVNGGDYDLRNAIAHSEYKLTSEGWISYASKLTGGTVVLTADEMDQKLERLLMVLACFQRSAMDFYTSYVVGALSSLSKADMEKVLTMLDLDLDEIE